MFRVCSTIFLFEVFHLKTFSKKVLNKFLKIFVQPSSIPLSFILTDVFLKQDI